MSIVMNKPETIGVRSADERRFKIVSKLAKADGAIVVAQDDIAADAARCIVAPETHVEPCANLLTLSVTAERAAKMRRDVLESALKALDVEPNEDDVHWARENVSRMGRIVRSVGKGEGRLAGIVKAIRDARAASHVQ